jgi:hypothetical protein
VGTPPHKAQKNISDPVKPYTWILLAGLCGSLVAAHFYPPLDMNPAMLVPLIIFFAPVASHVFFSVRKQLAPNLEFVNRVYKYAGIGVVGFALCLFLNGALDRNPSMQVHARISQKSASRGRGSTTYILILDPSWRDGRTQERLDVSRATFVSVRTGDQVSVDVHRGLFGLPWFSRVSPG